MIFRAPGRGPGPFVQKALVIPAAGFAAWPVSRFIDGRTLVLLAAGLLLAARPRRCGPASRPPSMTGSPRAAPQTVLLLALGFACLVLLVSGTYNPFIYFRF